MRYSRTGIVAVLLAAELFIGAAIVWTVTGGHMSWAQAAGLHRVSEQGKTFAPIDAGNAPHVVIDDPASRVIVTPATDGKVHVTDNSRTVGLVWGDGIQVPLAVSRTAEGVSIRRGDGGPRVAIFGFNYRRTEVALPPGATLEIRRCGGADLTGLTGAVDVHCVDGSISLSGVHAGTLKIASDDGSLHLDDVSAPSIDAVTNDGSIRANRLAVEGGRLQSADGSIHLALSGGNLTVHAHTGDGSIRVDGRRVANDSGVADYEVGTGGGSLQVSTQDGSIHISTNGAL